MDNKSYDKSRKNIKEYVILVIIMAFIIGIFTIRLPYSIYTPGGLIDIGKRVSQSNVESNYYLTYVQSIEGTIPSLLLAYFMPSWDIIDNNEILLTDEDMTDATKRDKIYLLESISNAINVAYELNNYKLNIVGRHCYVTYVFDKSTTSLKVGDEILSYDGIHFTNYEKFSEYISKKSEKDQVELSIVRKDLVKTIKVPLRNIEGEIKLGIGLSVVYDYDNHPNLTYNYRQSESGSSGGLMLTLTLYDILSDEDLAKGRKISGTGTINLDGTVGEIAGVKYKLAGAVKQNADIFIVPTANYEEAKQLKEENNYNIKIIEARNINQVIKALRNY